VPFEDQPVWRDFKLHASLALLHLLPAGRRKALGRRLRGREEHRKLQEADWLLVSWGKSGRTWLRVMLSRFYEVHFGLDGHEMLDFDNLARRNPGIPKIFFTHGNYLRDYTGHGYDTKVDFRGKRIVLLVRDPRDVAVSQYFQWKFRMRPNKKALNDYPPHGADLSVYDFMLYEEQGLPRVISYFNGWLSNLPILDEVLIVRYEDMRVDPGAVLARILEFTGTPGTPEEVADAVEYAAYENLKKREAETTFSPWKGWRLVPGDRSNPDSFKVRRAKVGGYRDYFSDEELAVIDGMVDRDLLPQIGYTSAERGGADPAPAPVVSSPAAF
jgi:hypothetical protein